MKFFFRAVLERVFFPLSGVFFTSVFLRGFYVGFDAGVCGDTDFFVFFLWGKLGDMIVLMSWRNVESWCRLRRGDEGKGIFDFYFTLKICGYDERKT